MSAGTTSRCFVGQLGGYRLKGRKPLTEKQRLAEWRSWARQIKIDTYTLWLVYRHPGTPWYAKLVAVCVAGYAFSPIDLIPDFIPVLGYVDDLILLPLGIMLALKLIPEPVLEECRRQARDRIEQGKPLNWVAGSIIIAIWLLGLVAVVLFGWRLLGTFL
ncbi:MAG: DUF1232 domain-containing protein [Anaerolineae bacterium]|nr:DUF1232 domain-containing protein [Anaerolineae bacterium]MCB0225826.1 DUF1232 domain-containing protein [Anaerolineae bacterium]MCB9109412.1 DUF1232 domain-containing protein [Anaerolineales bacterium]